MRSPNLEVVEAGDRVGCGIVHPDLRKWVPECPPYQEGSHQPEQPRVETRANVTKSHISGRSARARYPRLPRVLGCLGF